MPILKFVTLDTVSIIRMPGIRLEIANPANCILVILFRTHYRNDFRLIKGMTAKKEEICDTLFTSLTGLVVPGFLREQSNRFFAVRTDKDLPAGNLNPCRWVTT
jgi:hypothetical protein